MPHFKLEPCDFDKWLRHDSWPINQAALILMGYEPPPLGYLLGDASRTLYTGPSYTWDEPRGYRELLDLIKNSVENQSLAAPLITIYPYSTNQVRPDDLIEWAEQKNIDLPGELAEKVRATTSQRQSKIPRSNGSDGPLSESTKRQPRDIAAKSESAYLNIIGALCELYWSEIRQHTDKDIVQAQIIAKIQENFPGVSGLSERNLKEKLSAAINAIRNKQ